MWADDARKRCDNVTMGPWRTTVERQELGPGGCQIYNAVEFDHPTQGPFQIMRVLTPKHDADFVVYARTDLPFALAMLEEAAGYFRGSRVCDFDVMNDWLCRYAAGPKAEKTDA